MNDPRRLLDGDGSYIERNLLAAGHDENPNEDAKRHAAIALGIAAVSIWPAAASATAVATAKASKASLPLIFKLLAVGAVGAGTLGTAQYLVSRSEPPPATETVSAKSTPSSPLPARKERVVADTSKQDPTEAVPLESLELEQEASGRRGPGRVAAPAGTASIADEIRALDEARRALANGDAATANRALDAYRRNFPKGALAEESTLLRIEALARGGNRGRAKALADRFRARHPDSPHLRRIDSLLGAP
jgi:hypothetical protein